MGYIFQYHTHPIIRTKISLKSYLLQTQQRFCYSLYCMLMRNSLIWWRSLRTFAIGCIIVSGYVSSLTLKLPVLLLGLIGNSYIIQKLCFFQSTCLKSLFCNMYGFKNLFTEDQFSPCASKPHFHWEAYAPPSNFLIKTKTISHHWSLITTLIPSNSCIEA